jgi:hypothetical protein
VRSYAAHRFRGLHGGAGPLVSAGGVMDGMHRAAKARRDGLTEVEAVLFDIDPPPNHVGMQPDELTY